MRLEAKRCRRIGSEVVESTLAAKNAARMGHASVRKREKSRKASHSPKISWTICRIPVPPFDYTVKAGQPVRPETTK